MLYHKNGNQFSIVSTYKTHTYTYICNTIIPNTAVLFGKIFHQKEVRRRKPDIDFEHLEDFVGLFG